MSCMCIILVHTLVLVLLASEEAIIAVALASSLWFLVASRIYNKSALHFGNCNYFFRAPIHWLPVKQRYIFIIADYSYLLAQYIAHTLFWHRMQINSKKREGDRLLPKNVDDEDKNILKIHRKLAYATGNFLTVLAISLWFPYNVLYFHNVVGLTAQSAGHVVLFAQAGGAIATPFIGMWSDQCYCPYPGKRKIFHLFGFILTATVFFFLWYQCIGNLHCYRSSVLRKRLKWNWIHWGMSVVWWSMVT